MLGSIKAAFAAAATAFKSALPAVATVATATVVTGSFIYYYTIQDGIYEKRADNVRYVLEEYISKLSTDSIVDNGNGGYAYSTDLDKTIEDMVKGLKEAGSNITEYTGKGKEEELLSKFIKAEIITQFPDLRSEEEIRGNKEVRDNELQGGIKLIRKDSSVNTISSSSTDITYTIGENDQILTYIPYSEFSDKIANNDGNVKKHFSLKPSGTNTTSIDIVVASWGEEKTTVTKVEYIPNDDGTEDKKVEYEPEVETIYTYNEESINYQNSLSKYSMPAGFLWSILVMGESTSLVENLADLAIENTEIIIEAQDNVTTTVNTNVQKYKYKKGVTRKVTTEDGTQYSEYDEVTAKTDSTITTTIETKQSNTSLNLTYAETWVATYKKDYKNTVTGETIDRTDWLNNAEWNTSEDIELDTIITSSEDPNNDEEYEKCKNQLIETITKERCQDLLNKKIEKIHSDNPLYYLFNWDAENENNLYNKSVEYMYNYIKGNFTEKYIINMGLKVQIDTYTNNFWNNKSEEVKIIYENNEIEQSDITDAVYELLKQTCNSMITLASAQTEVDSYKIGNSSASNIQTVNTNSYTSAGTNVQERADIDKDKNFIKYFNESKRAKEYIMDSPDWLFEMLESHEKTANMIDLFKYLLYKSTQTSFGVTEYKFEEFSPNSFNGLNVLYGNSVEEKIWFSLLDAGYSKISTAAAMGNLYKESSMQPNNLEGMFNKKFGLTDEEYTEQVNNGTYPRDKFISDGAGYGLAQWTYPTRKEGFYDFAQEKGLGIDDVGVQIEYLLIEMERWVGTTAGAKYKNATTIKEATEIYCDDFENPKENNFEPRIAKAEEYYEKYKDLEKPSISDTIRYYQNDWRWGSNPYNYKAGGTIKSGGCGACALAMAVTRLTGQEVTPDIIVDYLNGLRINTVYSGATCAKKVTERYGLTYAQINRTNKAEIDKALDEGKCLIFSIKANGIYNGSGHYIMCYAREGDNYFVLESGRSYETDRPYRFDQVFTPGSQGVFVIGR